MKIGFFKAAASYVKALPHFLLFELILRLTLVTIGAPTMTLLLKLTMRFSKIGYISDEKIVSYLMHPATVAVVLIVVMVLSMFSLFELSALTACFSCSMHGRNISAGGMIRTGCSAVTKIFRSSGGFRILLIMPLAQFTLTSGVLLMPVMPIMRTVFGRINGALAIFVFVLVELLFAILIVNYSYSLHYLVLTDRPFSECAKESKKLVKPHKFRNLLSIFIWSCAMLMIAAGATFAVSFIVLLFIKGFSQPHRAFLSALRVLAYAWKIFLTISSFFLAPTIIWCLTRQFFAEVPGNEPIELPDPKKLKVKPITRIIVTVSLIAVSVFLNRSYIDALRKGKVNLNVGILTRTQITAHRGFSKAAPENTIYAFEAARDSGADYIELDVQLTKDGELVVFHDDRLDRVTNGSGLLANHTYAELLELSAGEWFGRDGEFADAKIPLLSEVFETIGDGMLYNVEIKAHGNTKDTVAMTVELIQEYDLVDSCYITSFSYDVAKKVKALDPEIKTGLIVNVPTTTLNQLKYVDALSMNHMLVNAAVVNNAHQNGKRIFVWTVDNTANMQNMSAIGVDNIITNRPDKAAELAYSKNLGGRVLMILKAIFG